MSLLRKVLVERMESTDISNTKSANKYTQTGPKSSQYDSVMIPSFTPQLTSSALVVSAERERAAEQVNKNRLLILTALKFH